MNKLSGNKPVITVVTVVYNGAETIENTILSCIHQTYQEIEYIIVDGKSKDNTVEIISKYSSKIACFISEPDNGIYDAMNKAIEAATGDWIIFMNSGDLFHDYNVLLKIADLILNDKSKLEIIYGKTLYKINEVLIKSIPIPLEKIKREMIFCHQSTFVKMDLIKSNLFNTKYKFAADYEMMYTFYCQNKKFKYVDFFISIFDQDSGITLKNFKQSTRERYSIHKDYGSIQNTFLMYKTIYRIQTGILLKKLIPLKFRNYLFIIKNKVKIVENESNCHNGK